jgi:ribose-phosphate pyrophosphokinase
MSALIAWPGNEALAGALARRLGGAMLEVQTRRFPDGETYVRFLGDCRGQSVAMVAALDRPDEKTPGLLFLAQALRDEGATRVGLVAPYLAYLRQDTRFRPGEAVSSKSYARLLSGAFDWLVTVDPHLHRYRSLSEVYSIPTTVVHAAPAIAAWVAANVKAPVLIGPDSESAQWVSDIARRTGAPWLVLDKTRHGDRDVQVSIPDPEKIQGRTPVLADDILSSGRTMIAAAKQLRSLGAADIVCIGVHPILGGDAQAAMQAAGISNVITCNSVAHPTNGIDLAASLAEAAAPHMLATG